MRKAVIVAGVVLAVSAGGAGAAFAAGAGADDPASERAEEAQYTQQHLAEAKISEQQAVAAALARHPGQATDVHLQDEGDGLRWEVKSDNGTQVWEIQVDAGTGAVVSDQPDD